LPFAIMCTIWRYLAFVNPIIHVDNMQCQMPQCFNETFSSALKDDLALLCRNRKKDYWSNYFYRIAWFKDGCSEAFQFIAFYF